MAASYDPQRVGRSTFEAYSVREIARRTGDALDGALVRVEAQRMAA